MSRPGRQPPRGSILPKNVPADARLNCRFRRRGPTDGSSIVCIEDVVTILAWLCPGFLSDVMIRFLSCALITLAVVTAVGAEPVQITVEGQARTFLLYRPDQKGPHPTILMLHRGNGSAEEEPHLTDLALRGPQHGFAVVFPQAIGGDWDFFPPGKEGP